MSRAGGLEGVGGGGGGGGMSRAAKKRAKKRQRAAEIASAAASSSSSFAAKSKSKSKPKSTSKKRKGEHKSKEGIRDALIGNKDDDDGDDDDDDDDDDDADEEEEEEDAKVDTENKKKNKKKRKEEARKTITLVANSNDNNNKKKGIKSDRASEKKKRKRLGKDGHDDDDDDNYYGDLHHQEEDDDDDDDDEDNEGEDTDSSDENNGGEEDDDNGTDQQGDGSRRKTKGMKKRSSGGRRNKCNDDEYGNNDGTVRASVVSALASLTPREILSSSSSSSSSSLDDNNDDGAEATTEERAAALLASLLRPSGVSRAEFYRTYWERRPLLVRASEKAAKVGSSSSLSGSGSGSGSGGRGGDDDDDDGGDGTTTNSGRHRLDGILGKSDVERMLDRNRLRYGIDLNVTKFVASAGKRITIDPPPVPSSSEARKRKPDKDEAKQAEEEEEEEEVKGKKEQCETLEYIRADPKSVWSHFANGCTIRLLRPHVHSDAVHALLSVLESEWGCMVGANAYLTPGPTTSWSCNVNGKEEGCQGFAPHYDDIEAFVLQLEGRKRWLVYPPPTPKDVLARTSSNDYTPGQLRDDLGLEPVLDVVLEEGDMLYMPRGWVHQARTVPCVVNKDLDTGVDKDKKKMMMKKKNGAENDHSLHLTVSAMQHWSWADLLELVLPDALESASSKEGPTGYALRSGLPRNFLSYMGTMNADDGLLDSEVDDKGVNKDGVYASALPEGLRQAYEAAMKREAEARTGKDKVGNGGGGGDDDDKDEEIDDNNDGDEERSEEKTAEKEMEEQERKRRLRSIRLRSRFRTEARRHLLRVTREALAILDSGCDAIGVRFLSDRQPPAWTMSESRHVADGTWAWPSSASFGVGGKDVGGGGGGGAASMATAITILPGSLCRLARPGIARLVVEGDKAVVYHCIDNSRSYRENALSPLEFELDDAPALEMLLTTVEPRWVAVTDLIHEDIEEKISIAKALYDEGILAVR